MELHEKILQARLKAGLTQENAARKANVTLRAYQLFEMGKNKPKNRRNLERALDVPFGTFEDQELSDTEMMEFIKSSAHALLADGRLPEADFDAFIQEMIEISEDVKMKNAEAAKQKKDGETTVKD